MGFWPYSPSPCCSCLNSLGFWTNQRPRVTSTGCLEHVIATKVDIYTETTKDSKVWSDSTDAELIRTCSSWSSVRSTEKELAILENLDYVGLRPHMLL
jgi:hypothetical protein